MCFSQRRGDLGVTLHCRQHWDDIAFGDGFSVLGDPPLTKRLIWMDEEALFWWWGFAEGIRNIGPKNEE
jgi:hypothetical protein